MHAKKCNQMLFNKNNNKKLNTKYRFKLYKETIPVCENTKFLGITFDLGLSFNEHIIDIKKKCINRLNIIKILSNKKWKLNKKTLTIIYLSLIRSIIDYSALIIPLLSQSLAKTIQSTQNTAFRIIYKLKYDTSTEEITKISKVHLIKTRAKELNEKYIKNALKFENELIGDLITEYKIGGRNFKEKTILCTVHSILNIGINHQ